MIRYATQKITSKDKIKVNKVLSSNFLTRGPVTKKFENKIANLCNSKYSISLNSASSGLHLACLAIGLKKNDVVWTTSNTYAATANAAINCGCVIDFVDINIRSYNISIENLKKKLKNSKKKLPKALIVVHFAGNPCDMEEIYRLSKIYKFKIIEDSSHALGARYKNSLIGDCKYSEINVFSFHPVKIITTGEGGMITTNKKKYYEKIKMLRSNGIIKNIKNKPSWYYEQRILGFNFHMNEIQAGLGISQLGNLKKWIKIRNKIAVYYNKNLKYLPLKIPLLENNKLSSFHLYVILLKNKKDRDGLFSFLKKKKIQCNFHYIPLYRHPFYKNLKFQIRDFKNSELYYKKALSLPMHPNISYKQLKYITNKIQSYFNF